MLICLVCGLIRELYCEGGDLLDLLGGGGMLFLKSCLFFCVWVCLECVATIDV